MNFNIHKKEVISIGAYRAFLKEPFKPTKTQKYLLKFFEVVEIKSSRYTYRDTINTSLLSENIKNKMYSTHTSNKKGKRISHKVDRLKARHFVKNFSEVE